MLFQYKNSWILFLSPPPVNQSSRPPYPTNHSLSSKSSRSGHEATVPPNHHTFQCRPTADSTTSESMFIGRRQTWATCAATTWRLPLICLNDKHSWRKLFLVFWWHSRVDCVSACAQWMNVYVSFHVDALSVLIQLMCSFTLVLHIVCQDCFFLTFEFVTSPLLYQNRAGE